MTRETDHSNGGSRRGRHRRDGRRPERTLEPVTFLPRQLAARAPVGATPVPGLVPAAFSRPLGRVSQSLVDAGVDPRRGGIWRHALPPPMARLAPPPSMDPLPRLDPPAPFSPDQLMPSTLDPTRRSVTIVAGVLATAVTLPPALGMGVGNAAVGPDPNPKPAVRLPSAIEAFSPYLPQVSCDPSLKPGVSAFTSLVLKEYKRGYSGGISRSCSIGGDSEHKEGRAWDWMLDPTDYEDVVAGQRVIDWLLADGAENARRFGVMYIIWNKRIWASYRHDEGWRPYSYGDPHTSHIHFSFAWAGAMQRTSWWTGKVSPTEYGPCQKFIGAAVPGYDDTINLEPCPPPKKKSKSGDKDDKDDKDKDSKDGSKADDVDEHDDNVEDEKKATRWKTITVRSGDTLGEIARRHDTTVAALVRRNDLRDPDRIFVGQRLEVPR